MLDRHAILHYTIYDFLSSHMRTHDILYEVGFQDVSRLQNSFANWGSHHSQLAGDFMEAVGEMAVQFRTLWGEEKFISFDSRIQDDAGTASQHIYDVLIDTPPSEVESTKTDQYLYYFYIYVKVSVLRKGIALLESSSFNKISYWDNAIQTTGREFIALLLNEGRNLEKELPEATCRQVQETSIELADYWENAIHETVQKFI